MKNESLLKCFCESRKMLSSLTSAMSEGELTDSQKEMFDEILDESQSISNKIKYFCKHYGKH